MPHSHAKPVPLCALEPVGEFKAVHLQQVKEGVSHHVRDAVSCLQQTAVEPAHSQDKCLTVPSEDGYGFRVLLSVTVAVRHGEDVAVEDAILGVEGQNGVLALVVFPAAAVCLCEEACDTRVLDTCCSHTRLGFNQQPTQISKRRRFVARATPQSSWNNESTLPTTQAPAL